MPAVTIHGPPNRRRRPGDGSSRTPRVPRRAGGRRWAEVGGGGRAAIRKYIIGHVGLCPLPVGLLKIAGNLICQSNQKENRHSK